MQHTITHTLTLIPLILAILWLGFVLVLYQDSPIPPLMYLILLLGLIPVTRQVNIPPRSLAQVLLISTLAALVMLYSFELVLRISDPSRGLGLNGPVGNVHYTWGHVVTTNSEGFREREFTIPKRRDTSRIVLLGDSITWGVGVAVTDRYSNILEDLLNQSGADQRYEVLNLSTGGGRTTDERDILRQYIDLLDPDLIIIGFNENDPEENQPNREPELLPLPQVSDTLESVRLTYLGNTTRKAVKRAAELAGLTKPASKNLNLYREDSIEWQNFIRSLQDIKQLSDSRQLPPPILTILNLGLYTNRPTDYYNPNEELKAILARNVQAARAAEQLGFRTIDHVAEIKDQLTNSILAINKLDLHPSPELHQMYAKKLYQLLSSQYEIRL